MDPLSTFTTFSLIISCILTLICIQQVLITPIQSTTARSLFPIRILNLLFASTETVYIILCLIELEDDTAKNDVLSESRFIFEMIRYFFVSICVLIFILDRLQYLYKIHMNKPIPIWIRIIYITLCTIFNITLIITFSISLYSTSSFYWKIQLIHLKLDIFISCIVGIIAVSYIYYQFNKTIQTYLNTILSQHNQLKEIETINNKLFDTKYMFQFTQDLRIKSTHDDDEYKPSETLTKENILTHNLNLAAKIREANYKLFSYIILLAICAIIDIIYIPVSVSRVSDAQHMHILTPPYIITSNLEFILQRILFDIILIIVIYWVYDTHSLFKILYYKEKRDHQSCIVSCVNGSLFMILFREIYLLIMYCLSIVCPCCIMQSCINLQQHFYDMKTYEHYYGHVPKTKQHKFIMIPHNNNDVNNESEMEESLPSNVQTQNRNRSHSHGIFNSPPIVMKDKVEYKQRRASQVSICGVIQDQEDDNAKESHHRKQSTLLQYDDILHSSESCDDLQVPQQIIDEDEEDIVDFDDNKSEQYDNFAEIMIQRERDYLNNKNNGYRIIHDKKRRESLHIYQESHSRGSINNLGKKRRNSLILNAVDAFKMTLKNNINYREKQQQTKESKKEALFVQSANTQIPDIDDMCYDDDEKEYYNAKTQEKRSVSLHRRSTDRLSAVRNSIKSMMGIKKKKKKERNEYKPFEFSTDTMVFHKENDDGLYVRQDMTTDTEEDDNISLATYGTGKDCLESDFESELNMLTMSNVSVSPNRSIMSWNAENAKNTDDGDGDDREESVSLSLESISKSEDEEASPPPPIIIIKAPQKNMRRPRKNSVPLAQIQEMDVASISSRNNLDVTLNISDFSDDMMSEAML